MVNDWLFMNWVLPVCVGDDLFGFLKVIGG